MKQQWKFIRQLNLNKIGERAVKKIALFFTIIFSFSLIMCGVMEKLANKDPMIKSVVAFPPQISTQDTTTLKVVAEDPDDDLLSYRWDNKSKGELLSLIEIHYFIATMMNRINLRVGMLQHCRVRK